MEEGNTQVVLHNESLDQLAAMLTEYAQIKRVTRQFDQAESAEMIRNTLNAQFQPGE
jgi:hypothetical protein